MNDTIRINLKNNHFLNIASIIEQCDCFKNIVLFYDFDCGNRASSSEEFMTNLKEGPQEIIDIALECHEEYYNIKFDKVIIGDVEFSENSEGISPDERCLDYYTLNVFLEKTMTRDEFLAYVLSMKLSK